MQRLRAKGEGNGRRAAQPGLVTVIEVVAAFSAAAVTELALTGAGRGGANVVSAARSLAGAVASASRACGRSLARGKANPRLPLS